MNPMGLFIACDFLCTIVLAFRANTAHDWSECLFIAAIGIVMGLVVLYPENPTVKWCMKWF